MDNQHQKISGYRDLSQEEIDLMNECKALAEQCGALVRKLRTFEPARVEGAPQYAPGGSLDQRWVSEGATDLQKGFMSLIRGIAQPTTF